MIMSFKKTFFNSSFWITSIVCLLPVVLGFYLWEKLPDDIPMQYGWDGEVNWTLPKLPGIFVCPVICLLVNILIQVSFYSKSEKINRRVREILCWVIPVVSVVVNSLLLLKPAGLDISVEKFVLPFCSLIFIIAGNYLPKTEPNNFIGIRAPWINSNPDVWRKTNRLGGILFVIMGIVNLAAAFTAAGKYVFVSTLIAVTLVVFVYSIVLAVKFRGQE